MKRLCILSLLIAAAAGCGRDGTYPARPITLVCPWSVGGGTDRVSRQMAFFLEHELGVPVNVINATGGRGVTGHSRGLSARPDGYTVAMVTLELNMLHWQDLTSITWEDAEPLMSVNEDAAAIWVPVDAPWKSASDLLSDVQANPGQLTASGTANGGAWHLALAGWLQAMDLDASAIKWIPMNGAAPSLQELASGGIDLVCCSLPEANQLYRADKVRCLGVMSEQRAAGYDEVPTFLEQGMDWTLVGWRGLAVPPGTPPDRVDTLVDTIRRIATGQVDVNGKTFPQFMAGENFNNRWREPDEFREFLKTNDEKFGSLLRSEAFAGMSAGRVGPYTYPGLIGIGIVLFGAITVMRNSRSQSDPPEPAAAPVDSTPSPMYGNAGLILIAIVAYLLLAETLGFLITVGILLTALLWRLGTHPVVSLAIATAFTPAVYFLFSGLLRVPLPRGLLD